MRSERLQTLIDMHGYCRPMGSPAERAFILRYIQPLPGAKCDAFGNWWVVVDDAPVLWSCHTDTVHRSEGFQTTRYDEKSGVLSLSKRSKRFSSCLGADDTAGVFMCREMILRKVPGTYVFHYGEERGGIGSSAVAQHSPDALSRFTMAIALDRAGVNDIITHQGYGRTASDLFTASLGDALHELDPALLMLPCEFGVYTDTAEYADLLPECTIPATSCDYSTRSARSM
jgi:hypothetical protein